MFLIKHRSKNFIELWFGLLIALLLGPVSVTSQDLLHNPNGSEEKIRTSIVGGKVADPGSTPWLVSLKDTQYSDPVHFCGGAILTRHWVLTTAHCIIGYENPFFGVVAVVGDYDLDDYDEQWESSKAIVHVVMHPDYDYFTRNYDIALLYVLPSIEFNERVAPLPLPHMQGAKTSSSGKQEHRDDVTFPCVSIPMSDDRQRKEIHRGARPGKKKRGYIAGWGQLDQTGEITNLVHEAYLPIIREEMCRILYPVFFTDAMICAGNLTHGGVDSCMGDYGGPMLDTKGYLRGVSSWSIGCGRPGLPAVFVDIHAVQDWICDVINSSPWVDLPSSQ